jgi:hypothetical protein
MPTERCRHFTEGVQLELPFLLIPTKMRTPPEGGRSHFS